MEKSSPIANSSPRSAAERRHCVLLVEDDGNDVELIQRAFNVCGCPVTLHVAYNGQEAIDHLIAAAGNGAVPELILTDIKMPIMDGFDLLRWLKPKSAHRRTPVVMLSSSVMDGDIGRAYDLGAAAYLAKPAIFEELTTAVTAMLAFWNLCRPPPAPNGEE